MEEIDGGRENGWTYLLTTASMTSTCRGVLTSHQIAIARDTPNYFIAWHSKGIDWFRIGGYEHLQPQLIQAGHGPGEGHVTVPIKQTLSFWTWRAQAREPWNELEARGQCQ